MWEFTKLEFCIKFSKCQKIRFQKFSKSIFRSIFRFHWFLNFKSVFGRKFWKIEKKIINKDFAMDLHILVKSVFGRKFWKNWFAKLSRKRFPLDSSISLICEISRIWSNKEFCRNFSKLQNNCFQKFWKSIFLFDF